MKKRYLVTAFILAGLQLCAADQKVGVVNVENVFAETKLGKQEQASFETMRKQFTTLLEDTEKQLRELNEKLQDKDTLDGLSPDAEQEMRAKFAQLSEEMNRYNQQYYQFIQQGQNKIVQTIIGGITHASEKLAAAKGYTVILNKQACFYNAPTLDVTTEMVKEMDKNFEEEAKKQAAATPATPAAAPAKAAAAQPEAKKEEPKQTAIVQPEVKKEEAKKPAVAAQEPAKKEDAKKEDAKKQAAAPKVEEKKSAAEAPKSR